MWYIIVGYITILLEAVCCKIFFDTFTQSERVHHYRSWNIIIALSIINVFVSLLLRSYFLCKQVSVIIVIAVAMKIYTGKSIKKTLALSMIYQALLIVADYLTLGFQSIFMPGADMSSGHTSILMLILAKAILFFVVVLIKSIFGGKEINILQDTYWIKFMYFPIFTICIIAAMLSKESDRLKYQYGILFVVIAIGLIGMNIVVFYLVNDIAQREKELRENRILEWESKNKLKLYETLSESVQKQKMLSHEFHNQINIIQGLCERDQVEVLKKYLADINGTYFCEMNRFETHNVIINTVLNEKYYDAVNNDILFVCRIGDMGNLTISDQDIALILSNLLNNAIEACQKCDEKRIIKIKMLIDDTKLILSVKNTYSGNVYRKNEQFLSTKIDHKENHGYGLKNVIKIIEKYDGEYVINTKENKFFISIRIPQK